MWLTIIFMCILGCSNSVTTSFDLSGVLSGNRMGGVPLGISPGNGEVDVEGICSEPGMACQNCSHAVTCVALPYGWLKLPLQECTEGFTCNALERTCSENPVPECGADSQKYTHTCEQVGIFPDAYDCRKFHLCSPPEDLPDGRPAEHRTALCPRNFAYNPLTAQCSIRLTHGQCDFKPVPDCKNVGQADALPFSPNHYYVCLVKQGYLYPQVFICPHGWYFWDGFCHPELKEQNTDIFNGRKENVEHDRSNRNGENSNRDRQLSDTQDNEEKISRDFKQSGKDSDKRFSTEDSSNNISDKNTATSFDSYNGRKTSRGSEESGKDSYNRVDIEDSSNNIGNRNTAPSFDSYNGRTTSRGFEKSVKDSDKTFGTEDSSNIFGYKDSTTSFDSYNGRKRESSEEGNPTNDDRRTEDRKEDSEEFKPIATTSRIDSFFSTERSTTYAADTFLADKFDLTHYESTDDVAPSVDEFTHSFESEEEFW